MPECLHRVVAEGPVAQLVSLPIMVCQTRDRIAAQGSPGFCPGFLLTRQQLVMGNRSSPCHCRTSLLRFKPSKLLLLRVAGIEKNGLWRQTNVSIARLTEWRDRALAGAATALKERERDDRDDEIARLKSKVGEVTMDNELLNAKIAALEGKRPLADRRSRR